MIVPLALITTVPFGADAETTVNGSPSSSVSLVKTATVTGVSSLVVATSLVATGGSLTGSTVTVTVAVDVPPLPSLIV